MVIGENPTMFVVFFTQKASGNIYIFDEKFAENGYEILLEKQGAIEKEVPVIILRKGTSKEVGDE